MLSDAEASPLAIPKLICELHDPNRELRLHAVATLRSLGREAQAAVSALIEALADKDVDVRQMAALALSDIDPEGKALVRSLLVEPSTEGTAVPRGESGDEAVILDFP